MNPSNPRYRKHVRMPGFDYRSNFAYFVSIVTAGRQCVFGEIADGVVRPSRRGLLVEACWKEIPNHHSFVELDAFILMPNHIHGILLFVGYDPEATQASQLRCDTTSDVAATPASPRRAHGPASRSLGAVVGSFKASVSRQINRLRPDAATNLWQPNFYEHVARSDRALEMIRDYILSNPDRWDRDRENPDGDGTDDFVKFIASLDLTIPRETGDAGVAATESR